MQVLELPKSKAAHAQTLEGALEELQIAVFSRKAVRIYKKQQLLKLAWRHSALQFALAFLPRQLYSLVCYDSLVMPIWRCTGYFEYRTTHWGSPVPMQGRKLVQQIQELRTDCSFRIHWLADDPLLEVFDDQFSAIIYGWSNDFELVEIEGRIHEMPLFES